MTTMRLLGILTVCLTLSTEIGADPRGPLNKTGPHPTALGVKYKQDPYSKLPEFGEKVAQPDRRNSPYNLNGNPTPKRFVAPLNRDGTVAETADVKDARARHFAAVEKAKQNIYQLIDAKNNKIEKFQTVGNYKGSISHSNRGGAKIPAGAVTNVKPRLIFSTQSSPELAKRLNMFVPATIKPGPTSAYALGVKPRKTSYGVQQTPVGKSKEVSGRNRPSLPKLFVPVSVAVPQHYKPTNRQGQF